MFKFLASIARHLRRNRWFLLDGESLEGKINPPATSWTRVLILLPSSSQSNADTWGDNKIARPSLPASLRPLLVRFPLPCRLIVRKASNLTSDKWRQLAEFNGHCLRWHNWAIHIQGWTDSFRYTVRRQRWPSNHFASVSCLTIESQSSKKFNKRNMIFLN